MKILMKIKFLLVLMFSVFVFSQDSQPELIVKKIDSIAKTIDENKDLIEGISEGEISNKKGDIKGDFSTYDLKNKSQTELFRIRDYSSTDFYYKKTYYYHNKKLIKAIIEIEDWNSKSEMQKVYNAVYHFENEKILKIENENIKFSNAKSVLKAGNYFNSEFYKKEN